MSLNKQPIDIASSNRSIAADVLYLRHKLKLVLQLWITWVFYVFLISFKINIKVLHMISSQQFLSETMKTTLVYHYLHFSHVYFRIIGKIQILVIHYLIHWNILCTQKKLILLQVSLVQLHSIKKVSCRIFYVTFNKLLLHQHLVMGHC